MDRVRVVIDDLPELGDVAAGRKRFEIACPHGKKIIGSFTAIRRTGFGGHIVRWVSRAELVNLALARLRVDGMLFPDCVCWERLVCQYGFTLEVNQENISRN